MKKIEEDLFALQDKDYQIFHSKLIPTMESNKMIDSFIFETSKIGTSDDSQIFLVLSNGDYSKLSETFEMNLLNISQLPVL